MTPDNNYIGVFLNQECIGLIKEPLNTLKICQINQINERLAATSILGFGLLDYDFAKDLHSIKAEYSINDFLMKQHGQIFEVPIKLADDIYSVVYDVTCAKDEIRNAIVLAKNIPEEVNENV